MKQRLLGLQLTRTGLPGHAHKSRYSYEHFKLQKRKEKKKLYLQKSKKRTTLILAKLVICGWFHSTPQKPELN